MKLFLARSFPVGSLLLVAFFLLVLASCAENKNARQSWRVPDAAIETLNPILYTVESVVKGKTLFEQHCQQCHGYWGEGNGVIGLSLDKRPANLLRIAGKKAEGEFAWKIAEGRGEMPAFRNKLSDDDIWNIVNFVQSLENEEGSSDPVAKK
jgi:mono/diheme cytochrome c family protein